MLGLVRAALVEDLGEAGNLTSLAIVLASTRLSVSFTARAAESSGLLGQRHHGVCPVGPRNLACRRLLGNRRTAPQRRRDLI